jgi:hypothetical protein
MSRSMRSLATSARSRASSICSGVMPAALPAAPPTSTPWALWRTQLLRLAQLLIERVVIADGGLEIIWRDQGWQELAGELLPGTIGAELQEMGETV